MLLRHGLVVDISGSGGPSFESRLCQVDVEFFGKALYMHFLTPHMCKTKPQLQAMKDLVSMLSCGASVMAAPL